MDVRGAQALADRIASGRPPDPPAPPRQAATEARAPIALDAPRDERDDRPWPWAVALAEAVRG